MAREERPSCRSGYASARALKQRFVFGGASSPSQIVGGWGGRRHADDILNVECGSTSPFSRGRSIALCTPVMCSRVSRYAVRHNRPCELNAHPREGEHIECTEVFSDFAPDILWKDRSLCRRTFTRHRRAFLDSPHRDDEGGRQRVILIDCQTEPLSEARDADVVPKWRR